MKSSSSWQEDRTRCEVESMPKGAVKDAKTRARYNVIIVKIMHILLGSVLRRERRRKPY